ncbi:MAG: hypothetical protein PHX83_05955 [Acidobacteriia bacterium]|nr:hypothetical protein [Terriglobia bacterium]
MLLGPRKAQIVKVAPSDIHGQRFHDLYYFFLEDPDKTIQASRVPVESVYSDPQPGDLVSIDFMMNVPTKVERLVH